MADLARVDDEIGGDDEDGQQLEGGADGAGGETHRVPEDDPREEIRLVALR